MILTPWTKKRWFPSDLLRNRSNFCMGFAPSFLSPLLNVSLNIKKIFLSPFLHCPWHWSLHNCPSLNVSVLLSLHVQRSLTHYLTIIHEKVRDKKKTSREKQAQTGKDRDRHGRTLTHIDRHGQTGTSRDRQGQTGTNMDITEVTETDGTDRKCPCVSLHFICLSLFVPALSLLVPACSSCPCLVPHRRTN